MYLLKFSICLLALLLFYILVLEKVHIHHFKRYYLLAVFVIALGIPLITFTEYVTVVAQPLSHQTITNPNFHQQFTSPEETNILSFIGWGIYCLGVVAFATKFLLNLKTIISSIRNNPKQRSGKLQHVLVKEQIAPHTFFSYLFFNLKNYRTYKIPQEVFWHEETHARQKHSMDILLLELLQIIFWFHPLIYWAKHLVKLNHEFLADQAVLNKGAVIPVYQNLVLAFSSNAIAPTLANAIHYSSIKKRIVIMKTQTSRKAIWLKNLLLIPLITLLLYSFSTKEILQIKKVENEIILPDHLKEKKTDQEIFYESKIQNIPEQEILISINKYGQLLVKDDLVKIDDLKSHLLNYNQKLTKEQRSQIVKALIQVEKKTPDDIIKKVEAILLDYGVATIDIKEVIKYQNQEEVTKNEIKEFNTLAKKHNAQPINERVVKGKDLKRLEYIYNRMSDAQKKNAQPFPECPAPAPAPKVMKNSKLPPPPPIPPTAPKAEREIYERTIQAYEKGNPGIIKTKKTADDKIIEVIEIIEDQESLPPPPPPYNIPDQKKHSKALLDAFKNFDEKANTYGKAVGAYMKKKEGTLFNLEALYEETMVLYDSYVVLAIKEDLMKPTPPSATKDQGEKNHPKIKQ
ncbi:hypothetical protein KCTC52924_00738 [Arenibacter antarcticus]|uniref:M56 family metallopeptidase n=1 Tax=Arenibacter antarcticus TaxID=2040469 RepID=A0ABW5VC39_9FLAO|nr:M56 family metallopeptidase [Arenibacter sp. H213]